MDWLKKIIGKGGTDARSEMSRNEQSVELVSKAAARRVFSEVVREDLCRKRGFVPRGDGILARKLNDELVQLADIADMKGQQFQFKWGVSLSFFPHSWSGQIQWHRTESSARFDLFQFADDRFAGSSSCLFYIDGLHGQRLLHEDTARAWDLSGARVTTWLDRVATIRDVEVEAARQVREAVPDERSHAPDPRLVQAFVWAKRGDRARAADALARLVAEDEGMGMLGPYEELRSALAVVAERSRDDV